MIATERGDQEVETNQEGETDRAQGRGLGPPTQSPEVAKRCGVVGSHPRRSLLSWNKAARNSILPGELQ